MEMNRFFLLATFCLCISLCAEAQPRHFKHESFTTETPIHDLKGQKDLDGEGRACDECYSEVGYGLCARLPSARLGTRRN